MLMQNLRLTVIANVSVHDGGSVEVIRAVFYGREAVINKQVLGCPLGRLGIKAPDITDIAATRKRYLRHPAICRVVGENIFLNARGAGKINLGNLTVRTR